MTSFSIKKRIKMSADKAWNVFSDFEHSPIAAFTVTVEEKGEYDSNGIGTIRIVTIGKRQFRERLEAFRPPNSLTYSLLSGAPVRDYTGDIDIRSIRNETLITWKVQFKPKILGTGWIVKWFIKNTINHILKEIETEYQDYRDRNAPHRASLPHHAAYGSVLRDSADQAESDPGERKTE